MRAQRCRAATLNGRHCFELSEADMVSVLPTPACPIVTEDIRDLYRLHRKQQIRRFCILEILRSGLTQ
jgi:hypothetical protein